MKQHDILRAREREFKNFMEGKTTNTREKEENWYYNQEFDECCAKCKYSEDDTYLILGERYTCPYCGIVDWNGWCKKFEVKK